MTVAINIHELSAIAKPPIGLLGTGPSLYDVSPQDIARRCGFIIAINDAIKHPYPADAAFSTDEGKAVELLQNDIPANTFIICDKRRRRDYARVRADVHFATFDLHDIQDDIRGFGLTPPHLSITMMAYMLTVIEPGRTLYLFGVDLEGTKHYKTTPIPDEPTARSRHAKEAEQWQAIEKHCRIITFKRE